LLKIRNYYEKDKWKDVGDVVDVGDVADVADVAGDYVVAGVARNEALLVSLVSYWERHTRSVWIAKTLCNHIEFYGPAK